MSSTATDGKTWSPGIAARFAQVAVISIIQAAILFLAAGRLAWPWAWVLFAVYLASVATTGTFLLRTSPATIAERGRPQPAEPWDKVIAGLWSLCQFFVILLVAGLDARFGWSGPVGWGWHVAGAVAMAAGLGLFGWSMVTNAYFSTVVRIQSDRGHTVCDRGPYRAVRHPGYAGMVMQSLGMPLLLGSWWALIPAGVAVILMIVRTAAEDRLLRARLDGYQEYASRVRHRLLPLVW